VCVVGGVNAVCMCVCVCVCMRVYVCVVPASMCDMWFGLGCVQERKEKHHKQRKSKSKRHKQSS
jgi:hypothetical protein